MNGGDTVPPRRRIAIMLGTRPEALKLVPLIRALRQQPDRFETSVIATAQHREMLDQVLSQFQIVPDVDLDLMRPNQTLAELTGGVLEKVARCLAADRPDLVVVQGDTTTAFTSALAAFYARIPIAHVEARLRCRDLVARFPDLVVVYPVHLNPNVREPVTRMLTGVERIHLISPLDYIAFVDLMRRAYVILTDSGGIQEEGPTLGKPLLVLRKVTERPEAFRAGLAKLVGTDRESIVTQVGRLLTDPIAYHKMSAGINPYGDGRAAERIVQALTRWFDGRRPLLRRAREFRPASQAMR